jgi:hypothetical protein
MVKTPEKKKRERERKKETKTFQEDSAIIIQLTNPDNCRKIENGYAFYFYNCFI